MLSGRTGSARHGDPGAPGRLPTAGNGHTRRAALKALALPALAPLAGPALVGCGRDGRDAVRVAVQWSGWELTAFKQVLAAFTAATGRDAVAVPMGTNINALLGAQAARAFAPDVAMLSQPGQVRTFRDRGRLMPISSTWADPFPQPWRNLVTFGGAEYGIWFKTAHKSMVWCRSTLVERHGDPPRSYQDWLALDRRLSDSGLSPLALGAADGWVLSDWFSNVLLGLNSGLYQLLVDPRTTSPDLWQHRDVYEALHLLGQAWVGRDTFPGGARRALLTQFDVSVLEVFTTRQAAMVALGDFAYPIIHQYARPAVRSGWFPFPPPDERHPRPVLVGGDVAVLLRPARQGGKDLVQFLASAAAANAWLPYGGFVSVRERGVQTAVYPEVYRTPAVTTGHSLIKDVSHGMNGGIYFSLSDLLTGPLAGGDGQGLWRILQQFLAQIGVRGSGRVDGAVQSTIHRIVGALHGAGR